MSRSQHYLDALLSGVPLEELSAFEHRAAFQHVKERLSGTQDVEGELKVLYRVNNFSELALQLLWIANRAEQDPTMLEPTIEEQTLVLSLFRHAVGDSGEAAIAEQTMTAPLDSPVPTPEPEPEAQVMEVSEPAVEPITEATPEPAIEPEPAPSTDFGFTEETPKEESSAADPFSMLTQPESASEATPSADPFGLSTPAITSPEAPVEEDPFAALRATPETTEEASTFSPTPTDGPAAPTLDFPTTEEPAQDIMQDFPSEPTAEPVVEAMADFPSLDATPPPVAQAASTSQADERSSEMQFAKLVERFAEAVSSGIEGRDTIKDEMLAACSAVLADESKAGDLKKFCQVVTEFISYIYENGFVDDIRVMNLLSNVPDPVWAWAKADDASRPGMMDAAYDTLREFKSLFE